MNLPFPVIEDRPEQALLSGHKLFRGEVEFIKGVVGMKYLPPADRVEFCFAGRSNVGKSSLINALTGRKALARASSTPGRTQEINFFALGESHYMVDLPGYGYAKAPAETVKKWQKLLGQYLAGRVNLRRVFLLIDGRHGAKSVDEEIMSKLDQAAVNFQVVMTKIDKVKPSELEKNIENTRAVLRNHPAAFPEIFVSSSNSQFGLNLLRAEIASLN